MNPQPLRILSIRKSFIRTVRDTTIVATDTHVVPRPAAWQSTSLLDSMRQQSTRRIASDAILDIIYVPARAIRVAPRTLRAGAADAAVLAGGVVGAAIVANHSAARRRCRSWVQIATASFGGLFAFRPPVSVGAPAASINTMAMLSTINPITRAVHNFTHSSGVPLVALAHARDTRAMRSAVAAGVTSTPNTETKDQWQPCVTVQIDCAQHRQHPFARDELSGTQARSTQHAKLRGSAILARSRGSRRTAISLV